MGSREKPSTGFPVKLPLEKFPRGSQRRGCLRHAECSRKTAVRTPPDPPRQRAPLAGYRAIPLTADQRPAVTHFVTTFSIRGRWPRASKQLERDLGGSRKTGSRRIPWKSPSIPQLIYHPALTTNPSNPHRAESPYPAHRKPDTASPPREKPEYLARPRPHVNRAAGTSTIRQLKPDGLARRLQRESRGNRPKHGRQSFARARN